jgi:hypothetical protein
MKFLLISAITLSLGVLGAFAGRRLLLASPPQGVSPTVLDWLGIEAITPSGAADDSRELAELSSKELFATTLEEIEGAKLSAKTIGAEVAEAQEAWEAIIAEVESGRSLEEVLEKDVHARILAKVKALRLTSESLWQRIERLVIPKTQGSHRYAEVAAGTMEEGSSRRELYMRVAASLAEQLALLTAESQKLAHTIERLRKAEARIQGNMNDLTFLASIALGIDELVAELRELNQDLQALIALIVPEE